MWYALQVEENDASHSPAALEHAENYAGPPEGVSAFIGVDEEAHPVEQDGGLDKRKDDGVAAAVDEDKLLKRGMFSNLRKR